MAVTRFLLGISLIVAFAPIGGCKQDTAEKAAATKSDEASHDGHGHEGSARDDHAHGGRADDSHPDDGGADAEHGAGHHDEVPLGAVIIGKMNVKFAQGHGNVAPGKEGHLVVSLPHNDFGATIVRAWIGTEDRTLSFVGKARYASSHDDYDAHAIAPDPLPKNVMWWVEIEKPNGTTVVGSVKPLLD